MNTELKASIALTLSLSRALTEWLTLAADARDADHLRVLLDGSGANARALVSSLAGARAAAAKVRAEARAKVRAKARVFTH